MLVRKPPKVQFDHASLDDAKAVGRTINRIQDAILNTVDQLAQQVNRLGSPDGTTLTNTSTGALTVVSVIAQGPNQTVYLKGTRGATPGDNGPDVVSQSTYTRTSGSIHQFFNNKTPVSGIDQNGNFGIYNTVYAAVTAQGANMPLSMQGNRNASDVGADVQSRGANTRTAGVIHEFLNGGVQKATVDYLGNFHSTNVAQMTLISGDTTTSSTFVTAKTLFTNNTGVTASFYIIAELFPILPSGSTASVISFRLSCSSSITWQLGVVGVNSANTATVVNNLSVVGTASTTVTIQIQSTTVPGQCRISGVISLPAGASVSLQIASNVSGQPVSDGNGVFTYQCLTTLM